MNRAWTEVLVAILVAATETLIEVAKKLKKKRSGTNMSELDKMIIGAAAAMVVIYLLGPSAIWRITKTVAEWALVILVLIWAL